VPVGSADCMSRLHAVMLMSRSDCSRAIERPAGNL